MEYRITRSLVSTYPLRPFCLLSRLLWSPVSTQSPGTPGLDEWLRSFFTGKPQTIKEFHTPIRSVGIRNVLMIGQIQFPLRELLATSERSDMDQHFFDYYDTG